MIWLYLLSYVFLLCLQHGESSIFLDFCCRIWVRVVILLFTSGLSLVRVLPLNMFQIFFLSSFVFLGHFLLPPRSQALFNCTQQCVCAHANVHHHAPCCLYKSQISLMYTFMSNTPPYGLVCRQTSIAPFVRIQQHKHEKQGPIRLAQILRLLCRSNSTDLSGATLQYSLSACRKVQPRRRSRVLMPFHLDGHVAHSSSHVVIAVVVTTTPTRS